MSSDARSDEPLRRKRRALRWVAAAAAIVFVALAAALWSGWPQAWLVRTAGAIVSGGQVDVGGIRWGRTITVDYLTLHAPEDDPATDRPLVRVEDIGIHYRLRSPSGRRVPLVEIGAVDLYAHPANYAFLLDRPADPIEPEEPMARLFDILAFVPEVVRVRHIGAEAALPDMELAIDGLHVEAHIAALDELSLTAGGADLSGYVRRADLPFPLDFEHGELDAAFRYGPNEVMWRPLYAQLPGWLLIQSHGSVQWGGGDTHIDMSLEQCFIDGLDLPGGEDALLPIPIAFDRLDASGSTAAMTIGPDRLDARPSEIRCRIENLRAGEAGERLYEGRLDIAGIGDGDRLGVRAALNEGQEIGFEAFGGYQRGQAEATVAGWSAEDVWNAVPPMRRPDPELTQWLEGLDSLTARVQWEGGAYTMDSETRLSVREAEGSVEALGRLSGEGQWRDGLTFDGAVDLSLADQTAEGPLRFTQDDVVEGQLTLAALTPRRWLKTFVDVELPEGLDPAVDGHLDFVFDGGLRATSETVLSRMGADRNRSMTVNASAHTEDLFEFWPLSLEGAVEIGGDQRGAITLSAEFPQGADTLIGRFELSSVDAATAADIAGTPAAKDLRAALTGPVTLQRDGKETPYELSFELAATEPGYGEWMLPTDSSAAMSGALTIGEDLTGASWDRIEVEWPNNMTATWTDGRATWADAFEATGAVAGFADLDRMAPQFELPELEGFVEYGGPLTLRDTDVEIALAIEGFDVAYGAFRMPYGTPLTAGADIRYVFESAEGAADDWYVHLAGEDGAEGDSLSFGTDPLHAETAFTLRSTLALLEDFGYLSHGEGLITATGTAGYSDDAGPWANISDFDVQAQEAALPDALGVLTDLALRGALAYGENGLDGDAELNAGAIVAAGLTFTDLDGSLYFEEDAVHAPNMRIRTLDGAIEAEVTSRLLADNFPTEIVATVLNVDLDAFTREFEPGVTLTGKLWGELTAMADFDGLQDATVNLVSFQDFSVNREAVRQLLLTQHVGEVGGGRALDRMVTRVVGPDEQRSFDRGEIELALIDERFRGAALLRSEALNMTIDLQIDPEAIQEALRLRQEAQLEQFDGVTLEGIL